MFLFLGNTTIQKRRRYTYGKNFKKIINVTDVQRPALPEETEGGLFFSQKQRTIQKLS